MIDTDRARTTERARRSRWLIPLLILGAVLTAATGGLIWFFSGEAPAEVDLASTASSVNATHDAETAATSGSIEGIWNVDTSIGDFTLAETTTATFVGFRVAEVLNSIGSTTAVGRTADVDGSITIEGTTVTTAEITADLTSIVSDESRREDSIQTSLGTSSNPTATFVLIEPVEMGAEAAEGEPIAVTASGTLTINGVSNPVEIELEAQLIDDAILVTGTTEISFSDYDVAVPTSPAVLSVEDHGTVEIQLWLSQ